MADNCILVFVKYPDPGKVKTRLAKSIGDKKAAALYKMLVNTTLSETDKTCNDIVVAVSEKKDLGRFKKWLGDDREYYVQAGKDLGMKMKNAFQWSFKKGYTKTVLIGTDCPERNSMIIETAFKKLEKKAIVIGPVFDGGYYLIGFNSKGFYGQVFSGIDWGTDKVLQQTIKKLKAAKKQFVFIKKLHDIDTVNDLEILKTGGNYGRALL